MNLKAFLFSSLFLKCFLSFGQTDPIERLWVAQGFIYCSCSNPKSTIGQVVKINTTGGVYKSINQSVALDWPSDTLRNKSGENSWGDFYPQSGDTGKIVYVFGPLQDFTPPSKYIYVLNIKQYFVPIRCADILKLDNMEK